MNAIEIKNSMNLNMQMENYLLEECQEANDCLFDTLLSLCDDGENESTVLFPSDNGYYMSDLDENIDKELPFEEVEPKKSEMFDVPCDTVSMRTDSDSYLSISSLSSNSLCSNDTISSSSRVMSALEPLDTSIVVENGYDEHISDSRHKAIKSWRKKKERHVSGTVYAARREIALKRPRTTCGKFQKSTVQFIPISQVQ